MSDRQSRPQSVVPLLRPRPKLREISRPPGMRSLARLHAKRRDSIERTWSCARHPAVGQQVAISPNREPHVSLAPAKAPGYDSATAAFVAGLRASWTSVFTLVLIGTYVGIGALAHDFGFSLLWVLVSTVVVWAGPAQVIMISALGSGAAPLEVALAVGLSGVRFLTMVVSLLPLLRSPQTRFRDLVLPAHFTAASMWVESFRLLPAVPRERRIAFSNGL